MICKIILCSFSFALLELGPKTEPHSLPIITIKKANFFDKFHVKATYTIHHVYTLLHFSKQTTASNPHRAQHIAISPPSYPPVWPSFIHAALLHLPAGQHPTSQPSSPAPPPPPRPRFPHPRRRVLPLSLPSSTTNQDRSSTRSVTPHPSTPTMHALGHAPTLGLVSIPFPFLGSLVLISNVADSTALTCQSDYLILPSNLLALPSLGLIQAC